MDAKNRILTGLAKYGNSKVSDIVKHAGVTWRHLDRILPEMEKDGLVSSYREGNKKIYSLTSNGEDYLRKQYEKIIADYESVFAHHPKEGMVRRKIQTPTLQASLGLALEDFLPILESPQLRVKFEKDELRILERAKKILEEKQRRLGER